MRNLAIITACLALFACAGDAPPKTTCLKRAASAEIAVTESYESTATLYKADVISKAKARQAVRITDSANSLVDQAGKLCQIDEPSALDYLAQAANLLAQVNKIIGEN